MGSLQQPPEAVKASHELNHVDEDVEVDDQIEVETDDSGTGDPEGGLVASKSLTQQTADAVQQFSIVIGVALMVGILFFLMIAVEQTMDWMGNQMSKMFGSKKS